MMLRSFAILLMSCVWFGHGTSEETCSLQSALNGAYDNLDEVKNENTGNDFIQIKCTPFVVSELGPDPVVFFDEVLNYKTLRLNVLVPTEESHRHTTLAIYNVTRASLYEKPPGSITVDDISNLQLEDLQPFDNCVVRIQTIGDCLFIVVWQNCLDSRNGATELIRSHYVSIARKNDFYTVFPPEGPEASTLVPSHFLLRGPRYTVQEETVYSASAYD